MIQHFHYKPMFENTQLPGWTFTFLYQGQQINGIYHKTGDIEWTNQCVFHNNNEENKIKKQLHELMLYHVYD
ncbi:YheE family protein [Jeotgalibacillus campisalis]|uniref:YheE n=1 Tax=Jeotgalibacillus campisalis TaxID=220754 RepID=A0A0C2VS92_9BACL|nr:YheE family protein [Jeotgalibacillus campisalis]KIL46853.1 hypothetical protein KR50_25500 [Jeotgalibacillus campisalis]